MSVLLQILVVLGVCLAAEGIAALLPIAFPASVIAMVLLFILLCTKWLKPKHIEDTTTFLLQNMALFFIPPSVGVLRHLDVLKANFLPILLICAVTTPLVLFTTAWTVQGIMRLMDKRAAAKEVKHD